MSEKTANSFKVLIVDDLPQNLGMLEKMLNDSGYHVFALTNGEAALKAARINPPDLMLLDIEMPVMDGLEVCRKMKEIPRLSEIPIIFITASNNIDDKIKGFKAGGVDFITKPFQFEEVEARVKTHLAIQTLRLELQKYSSELERKVIERTFELEDAYKRLEQIDKTKGDFLSMISHEVRTPLNGIFGVSDMIFDDLQNSTHDTESVLCLINVYKRSRERIECLLDDAMTINNLEVSNKNVIISSTPLSEILDIISANHIKFNAIDEAFKISIIGERDLLSRAIRTYCRLAMVFSEPKHEVKADLTFEGDFLKINVSLNNIKLSDKYIDRFFELNSTSRQYSNAQELGIAPVVMQKIIKLFDGEVKLIKNSGNSGNLNLSLSKTQ